MSGSENEKEVKGPQILHSACLGKTSSLQKVLQKCASGSSSKYYINHQDEQKMTPLHRTCQSLQLQNVKLLLDFGASRGLCDERGMTCLHYLCSARYENGTDLKLVLSIMSTLLEHISINCQASNGNTPLHLATMTRAPDSIKQFLMEKGADPSIKNERGLTPEETTLMERQTSVHFEPQQQQQSPRVQPSQSLQHFSPRSPKTMKGSQMSPVEDKASPRCYPNQKGKKTILEYIRSTESSTSVPTIIKEEQPRSQKNEGGHKPRPESLMSHLLSRKISTEFDRKGKKKGLGSTVSSPPTSPSTPKEPAYGPLFMVLAKATPKVNREFVDSENSFFRRSRGDILKGNLNMTFEARRQAILSRLIVEEEQFLQQLRNTYSDLSVDSPHESPITHQVDVNSLFTSFVEESLSNSQQTTELISPFHRSKPSTSIASLPALQQEEQSKSARSSVVSPKYPPIPNSTSSPAAFSFPPPGMKDLETPTTPTKTSSSTTTSATSFFGTHIANHFPKFSSPTSPKSSPPALPTPPTTPSPAISPAPFQSKPTYPSSRESSPSFVPTILGHSPLERKKRSPTSPPIPMSHSSSSSSSSFSPSMIQFSPTLGGEDEIRLPEHSKFKKKMTQMIKSPIKRHQTNKSIDLSTPGSRSKLPEKTASSPQPYDPHRRKRELKLDVGVVGFLQYSRTRTPSAKSLSAREKHVGSPIASSPSPRVQNSASYSQSSSDESSVTLSPHSPRVTPLSPVTSGKTPQKRGHSRNRSQSPRSSPISSPKGQPSDSLGPSSSQPNCGSYPLSLSGESSNILKRVKKTNIVREENPSFANEGENLSSSPSGKSVSPQSPAFPNLPSSFSGVAPLPPPAIYCPTSSSSLTPPYRRTMSKTPPPYRKFSSPLHRRFRGEGEREKKKLKGLGRRERGHSTKDTPREEKGRKKGRPASERNREGQVAGSEKRRPASDRNQEGFQGEREKKREKERKKDFMKVSPLGKGRERKDVLTPFRTRQQQQQRLSAHLHPPALKRSFSFDSSSSTSSGGTSETDLSEYHPDHFGSSNSVTGERREKKDEEKEKERLRIVSEEDLGAKKKRKKLGSFIRWREEGDQSSSVSSDNRDDQGGKKKDFLRKAAESEEGTSSSGGRNATSLDLSDDPLRSSHGKKKEEKNKRESFLEDKKKEEVKSLNEGEDLLPSIDGSFEYQKKRKEAEEMGEEKDEREKSKKFLRPPLLRSRERTNLSDLEINDFLSMVRASESTERPSSPLSPPSSPPPSPVCSSPSSSPSPSPSPPSSSSSLHPSQSPPPLPSHTSHPSHPFSHILSSRSFSLSLSPAGEVGKSTELSAPSPSVSPSIPSSISPSIPSAVSPSPCPSSSFSPPSPLSPPSSRLSPCSPLSSQTSYSTLSEGDKSFGSFAEGRGKDKSWESNEKRGEKERNSTFEDPFVSPTLLPDEKREKRENEKEEKRKKRRILPDLVIEEREEEKGLSIGYVDAPVLKEREKKEKKKEPTKTKGEIEREKILHEKLMSGSFVYVTSEEGKIQREMTIDFEIPKEIREEREERESLGRSFGKRKGVKSPIKKKRSPRNDKRNKQVDRIGNWDLRFREALETIGSFENCFRPHANFTQHIKGYWNLYNLAEDFVYTAKTYGKIIISESFLPSSERTLSVCGVGGAAGGDKYIVHNILFKFAIDSNGLFDDDHAAAKVGSHELKGSIVFFNALSRVEHQIIGLPLVVLVDYMGFRLVAESLLPIDGTTLIYGTCDGGRNMHNKDVEFSDIMKNIGMRLNLAPHKAGLFKGKTIECYSAADIEGHLGHDGRYRIIDFSRSMPPVKYNPDIKGSNLFRLFRPEFMMNYESPLCPDGYSGFVQLDTNRYNYVQDIDEATQVLHNKCKEYGRKLIWQVMEARENDTLKYWDLAEKLHQEGINVRYLGLVLEFLSSDEERAVVTRMLILITILTRVIKNEMKALLRGTMSKIKAPLQAPYRSILVRYLNWISGGKKQDNRQQNGQQQQQEQQQGQQQEQEQQKQQPKEKEKEKEKSSKFYWDRTLKKAMKKWFHTPLPFIDESFPLRDLMFSEESELILKFPPRQFLLFRLNQDVGIRFSSVGACKFLNGTMLDEADIVELEEKVKHMNIVDDAMGSYLYLKGVQRQLRGKQKESNEYFSLAIDRFEKALPSNPTNKRLLHKLANCLLRKNISDKITEIQNQKQLDFLREQMLREVKKGGEVEKREGKKRMRTLSEKALGGERKFAERKSSEWDFLRKSADSFNGESEEEKEREREEFIIDEIPLPSSLEGLVGPNSPFPLVEEDEVIIPVSDPKIVAIDQYYLRAVDCGPNDSTVLADYAVFTIRCGRAADRSDEYFLRSLEADPFNLDCLEIYGKFLVKRGIELGNQFLFRATNLRLAVRSLRLTKGETYV